MGLKWRGSIGCGEQSILKRKHLTPSSGVHAGNTDLIQSKTVVKTEVAEVGFE